MVPFQLVMDMSSPSSRPYDVAVGGQEGPHQCRCELDASYARRHSGIPTPASAPGQEGDGSSHPSPPFSPFSSSSSSRKLRGTVE